MYFKWNNWIVYALVIFACIGFFFTLFNNPEVIFRLALITIMIVGAFYFIFSRILKHGQFNSVDDNEYSRVLKNQKNKNNQMHKKNKRHKMLKKHNFKVIDGGKKDRK